MLFRNYCIISGSAEALVRCGGKLWHLLIAYFISNMCAKYYENPTMLSKVTAKNAGDVFWDTLYLNSVTYYFYHNAVFYDCLLISLYKTKQCYSKCCTSDEPRDVESDSKQRNLRWFWNFELSYLKINMYRLFKKQLRLILRWWV